MNVFAIYPVNHHIIELLAEAEARRLLRDDKPKGRGFVASILDGIRNATVARTRKLTAHA